MAALGVMNPTLLDYDMNLGPDGKLMNRIVELLSLEDEILDDITIEEANSITGHVTLTRTGIPDPTFRKLYGYVQPTKTTEVQIRDSMAMLANYLEVDRKLYELQNDGAAFMASRAKGILAGFNKAVAACIFYGNDLSTPEKFMGLAPRFNDTTAQNGANIIDGGGTGTVTSVWLANWGPDSGGFIYPKGSKSAGLKMEDQGNRTKESTSGMLEVVRAYFTWDIGLTIGDWRHFVRIANIDPDTLTKNAATGADLIDLMVQALEQVQQIGPRAAFYANRQVRSFLRRQIMNRSNVWLTIEEVSGKKVMAFGGVPVRRCDSLLNTEVEVT